MRRRNRSGIRILQAARTGDLSDLSADEQLTYDIAADIVTKAKAEAKNPLELEKILGVSPEEMMAIGDSPNDMAMMLEAGLPVAVGNAKEEVKAIAKYIAPTNHEDGVADAVEKFVLNT